MCMCESNVKDFKNILPFRLNYNYILHIGGHFTKPSL